MLQDHQLNDQLLKQGFVKLPGEVLDATARSLVRAHFFNTFSGKHSGFHNDFFLPNAPFRRRGATIMDTALRTVLPTIFMNFQPFLYTFLTKFASTGSTLPEHRDWMYVDELAGHRSYILYVAIDDGDEESGMVHVVPRSHFLPGPPCGTAAIWPWLKHREILRERAEPIALLAGEAAVWDNRLIHMSFENRSGIDRVALGAWCHRPKVPLSHFGCFDPGVFSHYQVNRDFFIEETPALLMKRRPRYPVVDTVEIRSGRTDDDALVAHLDGVALPEAGHAWTIRRKRLQHAAIR